MGITGLLPLIRDITHNVHVGEYSGKVAGIDAFCWLHRGAFTCGTELVLGKQTDKYVRYCMERIQLLLKHGVTPLMVFDGASIPVKKERNIERRRVREESREKALALYEEGKQVQARTLFQKAVVITHEMAHELVKALRVAGINYVVAPYEADAQLAYLSMKGVVDVVISEDSDTIPYGCRRVLFKMDKEGNGQEVERSNLQANDSPSFENWTDNMFLDMCLLAGCDYLPNVPGLGIKTAYKLVKQHRTYKKVIHALRHLTDLDLPQNYVELFARARLTFRHHLVYDPEEKTIVPLNPFKAAHLELDLSFLGIQHQTHLAQAIALGQINPDTHVPYDDENTPPAAAPPSSSLPAAAAATGTGMMMTTTATAAATTRREEYSEGGDNRTTTVGSFSSSSTTVVQQQQQQQQHAAFMKDFDADKYQQILPPWKSGSSSSSNNNKSGGGVWGDNRTTTMSHLPTSSSSVSQGRRRKTSTADEDDDDDDDDEDAENRPISASHQSFGRASFFYSMQQREADALSMAHLQSCRQAEQAAAAVQQQQQQQQMMRSRRTMTMMSTMEGKEEEEDVRLEMGRADDGTARGREAQMGVRGSARYPLGRPATAPLQQQALTPAPAAPPASSSSFSSTTTAAAGGGAGGGGGKNRMIAPASSYLQQQQQRQQRFARAGEEQRTHMPRSSSLPPLPSGGNDKNGANSSRGRSIWRLANIQREEEEDVQAEESELYSGHFRRALGEPNKKPTVARQQQQQQQQEQEKHTRSSSSHAQQQQQPPPSQWRRRERAREEEEYMEEENAYRNATSVLTRVEEAERMRREEALAQTGAHKRSAPSLKAPMASMDFISPIVSEQVETLYRRKKKNKKTHGPSSFSLPRAPNMHGGGPFDQRQYDPSSQGEGGGGGDYDDENRGFTLPGADMLLLSGREDSEEEEEEGQQHYYQQQQQQQQQQKQDSDHEEFIPAFSSMKAMDGRGGGGGGGGAQRHEEQDERFNFQSSFFNFATREERSRDRSHHPPPGSSGAARRRPSSSSSSSATFSFLPSWSSLSSRASPPPSAPYAALRPLSPPYRPPPSSMSANSSPDNAGNMMHTGASFTVRPYHSQQQQEQQQQQQQYLQEGSYDTTAVPPFFSGQTHKHYPSSSLLHSAPIRSTSPYGHVESRARQEQDLEQERGQRPPSSSSSAYPQILAVPFLTRRQEAALRHEESHTYG